MASCSWRLELSAIRLSFIFSGLKKGLPGGRERGKEQLVPIQLHLVAYNETMCLHFNSIQQLKSRHPVGLATEGLTAEICLKGILTHSIVQQ